MFGCFGSSWKRMEAHFNHIRGKNMRKTHDPNILSYLLEVAQISLSGSGVLLYLHHY